MARTPKKTPSRKKSKKSKFGIYNDMDERTEHGDTDVRPSGGYTPDRNAAKKADKAKKAYRKRRRGGRSKVVKKTPTKVKNVR